MLMQSLNEHKPLVEKLTKTGEALAKLCAEEESSKVMDIVESDNGRYAALRSELRARQQALEQALQVIANKFILNKHISHFKLLKKFDFLEHIALSRIRQAFCDIVLF